MPPEFHDVPHGREPQERGAIFRRERTADVCLLLDEFIPEIVIVRDQLEWRGQAEIVPVVIQQLEAKSVNGSEPGAIERRQNFGLRLCKKDLFARALLHFVRGAVGESENDETWQR